MTTATIDLRRALAIKGWITPAELAWLADQARSAYLIVECGSFRGRSTRALADHGQGVVYAIDTWGGPCLREDGQIHGTITEADYTAFRHNLKDHMEGGTVVAVHEPSVVAFPRLAQQLGPTADLIFIDGDHRYAACAADIDAALLLLRPGGLLCGHDYTHSSWPGVHQAVTERFGTAAQQGPHSIWWVQP